MVFGVRISGHLAVCIYLTAENNNLGQLDGVGAHGVEDVLQLVYDRN